MIRTAQYTVPQVTVLLGMVLDLQLERGNTRTVVDEWAGWALLTTETAMELEPGHAKLILLAGELHPRRKPLRPVDVSTYERWHQRAASELLELDAPDQIGFFQGRVVRLGYRSDKWGRKGQTHDYDHAFTERGHTAPKLYTDTPELARARGAVIVGGDMSVTSRGIA